MENRTDLELVDKVQNKQCNSSIKVLINRHADLFFSICNKTCSRQPQLQEVIRDKEFVIWKAVTSFKADKNVKFSTWLGNMTRYHCLNFMKKESKYVEAPESTTSYFLSVIAHEQFARKAMKTKIDHVFTLLKGLRDKRIEKIFVMRYLAPDKMTWKKIASEFRLTPQTVISLHTKGRKFLKKKLDSETV